MVADDVFPLCVSTEEGKTTPRKRKRPAKSNQQLEEITNAPSQPVEEHAKKPAPLENDVQNRQKNIYSYFSRTEKLQTESFGVRVGCFAPMNIKPGMVVKNHPFMSCPDRAAVTTAFESTVDNVDSLVGAETIKLWKSLRTKRSSGVERESRLECVESAAVDNQVLFKVKFLKFHENFRPPYYGTWRKTANIPCGKRPFHRDPSLNYEVESDLEWEEEDPGEDLMSDSNDKNVDGDGDVDEEEPGDLDSFLVPHGYLSEDEGIKESGSEAGESEAKPLDVEKGNGGARYAAVTSKSVVSGHFRRLIPCLVFIDRDKGDSTVLADVPHELFIRNHKIIQYPVESVNVSFINTSETEQGKGRRAFFCDKAVSMLIEIVHNNSSINKLVDEFRDRWHSGHPDEPNFSKSQVVRKIREMCVRKGNNYIVQDEVLRSYGLSRRT